MILIANNKNIVRNLKIAGDIPPRNLEPIKTPKRINNADKGTSLMILISIKPEGIKKKIPMKTGFALLFCNNLLVYIIIC